MPARVDNVLLPPVIQKILPPQPKEIDPPPSRQSEDFEQALKTARDKSTDSTKTDQVKDKPKETKATDKKSSGKAEKSSTKNASKTTKTTKPAHSKTKTQVDADAQSVDEADDAPDAQNETETAGEAQNAVAAEQDAPVSLPTKAAKTDQAHKDDPDHPERDQSASDPAGAQLVQPIDRPKDNQPRRQQAQDKPDEDADTHAMPAKSLEGTTARTAEVNSLQPPADASTNVTAPTTTTSPSAANTSGKSDHAATVSPLDLGADPVIAPAKRTAEAAKPPSPTDQPGSSDEFAAQYAQLLDAVDPDAKDTRPRDVDLNLDPSSRAALEPANLTTSQPNAPAAAAKAVDAPPLPPEVQFAQSNHDKIVTGIQTQLLPHGGSMQIRLDPPELGALRVMVEMRDGVMNATFQTSNEEATQVLSHSLNQLKHVLESQGVSVERLQVQQAPRNEHQSGSEDNPHQRNTQDDHAARQEQQRKEMMRRMWRKVSGAGDPIDYLA